MVVTEIVKNIGRLITLKKGNLLAMENPRQGI